MIHLDMEFKMFCNFTNMWEDDPTAMLAFVDYVDQDQPLSDFWAEYSEDYV